MKQTTQDLKKGEEQFRSFFDNNPDYCYLVSIEGKIVDANLSAQKILGFENNELSGKPIQTIYAPESHSKMEQLYDRCKNAGRLENEEMVIITKEGEKRNVLLSVKMIIDEAGKPLHSLSIQKDITQLKQAEKIVHEKDALLKKIGIISKIGGWEIDLEAKTSSWTDEVATIYEVDSVIPVKEAIKHYPPESKPIIEDALWKLVNKGESYDLELPFITAKGRHRWIRTIGTPTYNKTGKAIKAAGILQDITDQKQTEEALRESEEKYKNAFKASPDPVSITGLDGEFFEINDSFTQFTGFTHEDVIGKLTSEIGIWSIPENRETFLEGLRKNGYIENMETKIKCKNGSYKIALISARIIKLSNGPHILTITKDITRRKHQENLQSAQLRIINYAVSHTDTKLLQKVIDEVEQLTDSQIGYFHFVEDDQTTMSLQTQSTNTMEKMCTIKDAVSHYPISKAGPWVDCV